MKIKGIILIFLTVCLSGCYTVMSYHEIREKTKEVNYVDGINKQEAVLFKMIFG